MRRQQEKDIAFVLPTVRQLSKPQFELFFLLNGLIARHKPNELSRLADDDVAEAAAAIATTYETAARGVLYEHVPESGAARRLVSELKELLGEIGKPRSSFEQEAIPVLRSIERGAREIRQVAEGGDCAYVLTMERLLRDALPPLGPDVSGPSKLIVP